MAIALRFWGPYNETTSKTEHSFACEIYQGGEINADKDNQPGVSYSHHVPPFRPCISHLFPNQNQWAGIPVHKDQVVPTTTQAKGISQKQ